MFSDQHVNVDVDHFDMIDTDNEKYVVHKEWPLFGTLSFTNYFQLNGSTPEVRRKQYRDAAKKFKINII